MKILSLLSLAFLPFVLPASADTGVLTTKPQVIIMLGAPGSGKGTQAVRLTDKLHLPQISTGDLFRENLKGNTPTGQKAKGYMDRGELVPDELVLEMLFQRIKQKDCENGYILDGFPRTIPQAEALTKYLGSDVAITAFSLEVPDEVIIGRIAGRLVCSACGAPYHIKALSPKKEGHCDRCDAALIQRKDDTEEVVKERLAVFHKQSEPLKDYYKEQGVLILIDAANSKEKTHSQIDQAFS